MINYAVIDRYLNNPDFELFDFRMCRTDAQNGDNHYVGIGFKNLRTEEYALFSQVYEPFKDEEWYKRDVYYLMTMMRNSNKFF